MIKNDLKEKEQQKHETKTKTYEGVSFNVHPATLFTTEFKGAFKINKEKKLSLNSKMLNSEFKEIMDGEAERLLISDNINFKSFDWSCSGELRITDGSDGWGEWILSIFIPYIKITYVQEIKRKLNKDKGSLSR